MLQEQNVTELLSRNLILLSSYPIGYIQNLQEEIKHLKKEIDNLDISNKNLRSKNYQYLDELDSLRNEKNCKRKRDDNDIGKYKIIKHKKSKESFDEDQIDEIVRSIKNLEDMEKVNEKYKNIKHNEILLKMCLLNEPLKKLNKMVGLDHVKKEIFKKIIYYLKNPNNDEYLHSVISGPPGVGKTELAKIYGEIFSKLGILKNRKFVQIKRDDLVAQYLGQTSHRTKKLLEDSLGGVLFLDEAYSLGSSDKVDSYSKEAIDMINQYLSEKKNDFMFIIAGYETELNKCFFSINPGLKRRFSTFFNIDKYSSDELLEIFKLKLANAKYNLNIDDIKMKDFFKSNFKKFSNYAGDIEKLINEMKYVQSFRTFSNNIDSKDMIYDDLQVAIKIFKEEEDRSFLSHLYV